MEVGERRTYYSSVLGPIDGSGVKTMVWVFEVSTLGVIVCKRVLQGRISKTTYATQSRRSR